MKSFMARTLALALGVLALAFAAPCAAQGVDPTTGKIIGPAPYGASGVASVTGTITSATNGLTFPAAPGRAFNITFSQTGTGSCQLERQIGGSWYPVTVNGLQLEYWSGAQASDQWFEPQYGVLYRINCASSVTGGGWVSGTVSYRFDQ